MPYTDATLADFIVTTLGPTGVALGLTVASAGVVDAVAEVEAVLSVDDISDLDDDLKTRTVTRWIAWRTAAGAATGDRNMRAGTASIEMSQRFDHIQILLRDAEAAALRYTEVQAALSGTTTAYVTGSGVAGSPYGWPTWPEL